jgi:hypothetical protein
VNELDTELRKISKFPSKEHLKCVLFLKKLEEKFEIEPRKQVSPSIEEQ